MEMAKLIVFNKNELREIVKEAAIVNSSMNIKKEELEVKFIFKLFSGKLRAEVSRKEVPWKSS